MEIWELEKKLFTFLHAIHKHRHFLMLMCITNNDCFFFLLIYFSSAQFLHYFLRSGNIKCISSEQKMQMMRQKNAVTKENRIKKEINKRLQSIIQIDLLMHLVALAREREEEKIKCLNGTIEWTWLFWTKEFLWTSFRSSTFSFVSTRFTSMQKNEKKTDSSKQLLSESMVVCVYSGFPRLVAPVIAPESETIENVAHFIQ